MTVACISNARAAPPGLSLMSNTTQGKKMDKIERSNRCIFVSPFFVVIIHYSGMRWHFASGAVDGVILIGLP